MLTKRLSTILTYLEGFTTLIDVGTDHAYLPIEAVRSGVLNKAYAIDNKKGPLKQALNNIKTASLDDKITVQLSSGITYLPEDADVLVMAGMGGDVMYHALHHKPYKNLKRLVLQPNTGAHFVRKLTEEDPWKIVDETVVDELDYFYPIIVLEQGEMQLTEKDLQLGPILMRKRETAFLKMLMAQRVYLIDLINAIPYEDAKKPHQAALAAIEEVLYERNDC